MTEAFRVGDLVWAKMKGFSPWPGKVANPPKDLKRPANKKPVHCVFFYGTDNFAWIEDYNIKPYLEFKDQFQKSNKSAAFRDAVKAIEDYIANPPAEEEKAEASGDEIAEESAEINDVHEETTELKSEEESPKESPEPVLKKEKKEPKPRPRKESSVRNVKRRRSEDSDSSAPKKERLVESVSSVVSNHTTRKTGSGLVSSLLDRPTNIQRPDTPPLDVERVTQTLKDKNIQPSTLKFGFLGLGIMGAGIVKNLLNSGHHVVVWNRTPDKCRDFVKAGAEEAMTPSDVICAADITFSCVADPHAAKEMVFGNCGVLQEMTSSKSYVEMTNIDAETSQDIADAVNNKGGRYLEAQIQGSKTQAQEGTLVILAAGDKTLFDDCQSCFQAMGKNSFFLGEVGCGAKMNLVLQLMAGVTLVGLGEGMALADRAGLQQRDVLEVLELTSLACPLVVEKSKAILEGAFPTHLPLQHMQKDLKLALAMGDQLEQPLPVAASANEVFKHAKRLGYADHDVSAVYIRARF